MAGKKKSMGRGLGSLLDRRTTSSASANHGEAVRASDPKAASVGQADEHDSSAESAPVQATEESGAHTPLTLAVKAGGSANANARPEPDYSAATNPVDKSDKLRLLGLEQIQRCRYQPRRQFDPQLLQELADSIKSEGLIQPILVRPVASGKFELIAGERRWKAAQLAGLSDITAIVRVLDDRSVAAMSLVENIQRKDLNPLEEAEAMQRLCEEFAQSHREVAVSVGRSRSAVTNLMRLLDLHDEVKALIDSGEIGMGHARALLGAALDDQPVLARRIAQQGLTVRAVERQIKALRAGKVPPSGSSDVRDPDIERLAKHLGEKLGAQVSIRHKSSGTGKLEITYNSMDELDGILNHIR